MTNDKTWDLVAKKLSGEATPEELNELGELLKKDPDVHYTLQAMSSWWGMKAGGNDDAYDALKRHINRLKAQGVEYDEQASIPYEIKKERAPFLRRKITRYSIAALLLLAVVGSGFYYWNSNNNHNPVAAGRQIALKDEVSVRYGSKSKLVLADGTQVWLNSGSKLSYNKNNSNGQREVSLTGEAYFDVFKDPVHPFIIHTGRINIKVLGTAFNVRSYPGEKNIETSLIRGRVEVTIKDRPSESIILKPNEKLVIPSGEEAVASVPARNSGKATTAPQHSPEPIIAVSHLTYAPKDSTIIETAWLENKLIFQGETFEDLAIRMERWYGISFRFKNEAVKKEKLTGVFENETVQEALSALQLVAPFRYAIGKNEVVIMK